VRARAAQCDLLARRAFFRFALHGIATIDLAFAHGREARAANADLAQQAARKRFAKTQRDAAGLSAIGRIRIALPLADDAVARSTT
jgi:hypothetical protein